MTTKTAILQAIRHKCLDCCVYQPLEVRECTVSTCGLWPFRFGADPNPSSTRGFARSRVYTDDSRHDEVIVELASRSDAGSVFDA